MKALRIKKLRKLDIILKNVLNDQFDHNEGMEGSFSPDPTPPRSPKKGKKAPENPLPKILSQSKSLVDHIEDDGSDDELQSKSLLDDI